MIGNYDNKNVTVHAISLHQKISLAVPQPNPRKKRYSTDKTNPTQVMYLHILGAHALTRIQLMSYVKLAKVIVIETYVRWDILYK